MIPPILADRIAYVSLREALERRASTTADMLYYHRLVETTGEEARPAYDRASFANAKAQGYLAGVIHGLRCRYEESEVRQFLTAAAAELDDPGIVREGDLPSTPK